MYQKEIIYIGLYRNGERVGSAGFLKAERRERESRLYLKVQNVPLGISGRFPVRVYNGSDWKEINGLTIRDGGGIWQESLAENSDKTMIQVMLSGGYMLEGKGKSVSGTIPSITEDNVKDSKERDMTHERADESIPSNTDVLHQGSEAAEPSKVPETVIVTEELPRRTIEDADSIPQSMPNYNLKEDKWEQILDTYENIHPYGDGRLYVKLEPKDFVILQSKYQHLVNNSFLLHGFYNYRFVILGKENGYYLGVPGVFYEREKMVAQMFGFEAFECPGGDAKAGEFGYYLRKVEL